MMNARKWMIGIAACLVLCAVTVCCGVQGAMLSVGVAAIGAISLVRDNQTEQWAAAAAYESGDLVQTPAGEAAIVMNQYSVAIGEQVVAQRRGLVSVANSGITPSAGDLVGYDATDKDAVAAGSGDFDIGVCAKTAGATDPVLVFLNEAPVGAHLANVSSGTDAAYETAINGILAILENAGLMARS